LKDFGGCCLDEKKVIADLFQLSMRPYGFKVSLTSNLTASSTKGNIAIPFIQITVSSQYFNFPQNRHSRAIFHSLKKEVGMYRSKNRTFISAVITLIFLLALSLAAVADKPDKPGRAKGKKSEKQIKGDKVEKGIPKIEKKDDKFINDHDARDGRLDGRGPKKN
jgi:hypothetical protein